MAPTARDAYQAVQQARTTQAAPTMTLATLSADASAAAGPIRAFLTRHTHASELDLFVTLRRAIEAGDPITTLPASQPTGASSADADDWTLLVPAFVVSELSEAVRPVPDHRSGDQQRVDVDGHDHAVAHDDFTADQAVAVRARRRLAPDHERSGVGVYVG
jgi:hypothetical protein